MDKLSCLYCGGRVGFPYADQVAWCIDCGSLTCPTKAPPYEPDYHAYKFSFLRPKLPYLAIKAFQCGLTDGLTVCDIGCGAGHSLWFAKHLYGCTTIGYDIPAAEKHVKGCDRFFSNADKLVEAWRGKCDLVWCWHTIEHTDSPLALMVLMKSLLAPKGRIYLEMPLAEFVVEQGTRNLQRRCTMPEHRGLPSRQWITGAAVAMGLKIISAEPPKNPNWLYGSLRKTKTDLVVCMEHDA